MTGESRQAEAVGEYRDPVPHMHVYPRAILHYDARCWLCRVLSLLCVVFALGAIRRISLVSEELHAFHHHHPEAAGRLTLITHTGVTYDEQVFFAVFRVVFRAWASLLRGRKST